jgi:hypothetical protein
MKYYIFFYLFLYSGISHAQSTKTDFIIYFGNQFENDSVTVQINGVTIVKGLVLKNTMIAPKSLVLTQEKNILTMKAGYDDAIILPKIKYRNSLLKIRITINGNSKEYQINLKKGKYLFVERNIEKYNGTQKPFPDINQSDLPAIYI